MSGPAPGGRSAGLRVLVQLQSLALGGTQLNALDFAVELNELGVTSYLRGPDDTVPDSGPGLMEVAAERGVEVEAFPAGGALLADRAPSMTRRAAELGVHLVHVYGEAADPRAAFWGPCRFGRRPLVQTIYEMAVDPRTYRHSALVIGTGYLRDELASRPGPTTLISPPVDLERDRPDDRKAAKFLAEIGTASGPLVVIVSRLDRAMKAYPVEVAIRAVARLADLGARLVVVGTGEEAERLAAVADEVNRSVGREVVRMHGPMGDPRPAYAAADIVLGMGGSAARALAFGRTLIVQGEHGTAEPFTPTTAASLYRRSFWSDAVEPEAVDVLVARLRDLAADPGSRADLGDFGRRFAVENFGLAAMTERLAGVYEEAARRYGPRAWACDLAREGAPLGTSAMRRLEGLRPRSRREAVE